MKIVLGLCFLAVLSGCGSAAVKQETVIVGVRNYGDGLRWQRFEQAATRLPQNIRIDFLDVLEEHEDDLQIDDYEVSRLIMKKPKLAEVSIRWFWHLETKGVVHKTTTMQIWEQHGKKWSLTSETHIKGEKIPGLPIWAHLKEKEDSETPI